MVQPVRVLPHDVSTKPYFTERALILQNKEDAMTGMTRACWQLPALMQHA